MFRILTIALWITAASLFLPVWPLELIASFLVYALIISSVILFSFIVLRRAKATSFIWAMIPWAIMLIIVLGTIIPSNAQSNANVELTFYTHNMLYSTDNGLEVAATAKAAGADIIALQESYAGQIEQIRQETGFRDSYVSDCDCSENDDELGLVTRYPILRIESFEIDVLGGRMIEAFLNVKGHETRVVIVHLPVPTKPSTYATRERGFSKLQETLDSSEVPTILAGDFNTTLWSPTMRGFMADNKDKLVNVAVGRGLANTWCGLMGLVCLRIDHTFVDASFAVDEVTTASSSNSDHKPLISKIRL